jgi:2-succinyl-5-enolpyruvyl-6-hydroxy-3-cyclohexene-1-carboxylate synthase
MNIGIAKSWIQNLINCGVKDFCLCAGARNSPLVVVLDQLNHLEHLNHHKIWNFFEERSASFFALGKSCQTRLPVAVITTSGTAVAELLPAVIESYYTNRPLILVTADRPKVYRGRGAPQSIEQIGIFSHYCKETIDIDLNNFNSAETFLAFESWDQRGPIHLNICFDEPLIDEPFDCIQFEPTSSKKNKKASVPMVMNTMVMNKKILDIKNNFSKPLVIVSGLSNENKQKIKQELLRLNAPLYLESTSGLKGDPDLDPMVLKSGEKFISLMMSKGQFDSVIRVGGVPTLRLWRDLEDKYKEIPVVSFAENQFTGLSRVSQHFSRFENLKSFDISYQKNIEIYVLDKEIFEKKMQLLEKFQNSEQALFFQLAGLIDQDPVYIGNSLPIRYWDEFSFKAHSSVFANRGANGIDGQISTFLGWSESGCRNWCVVGDLTAMYDLSSLWITPQMTTQHNCIVIINNKGGQIFKKMFAKEIFINSHNLSFSHWAKMWNWNYKQWNKIPSSFEDKPVDNTIIEINPSAHETEQIAEHFEALWKKYL